MTDFLSKPLDPQTLIRTVARQVARTRGRSTMALGTVREPSPVVATPEGWPVIAGVDGAEVASRLGNDVALFASMLDYLVRELNGFTGFVLEASPDVQRAELAARLHKLRGSAATLGVRAVREAASAGEHQARRDPGAEAMAPWIRAVREAGDALREAVGPFLAAHRAKPIDDAVGDAPPLDEAQVRALYELLQQQDLAALDHFHAMAAPLRAACGAQFDALTEAMERFEFARAAELMSQAGLASPHAS